jgi:chromosome partitioning protein
MKTLVVANQKGGVGKTSTLVHLAFDFLEQGLKVVVIDLDTQGNASYTLQSFRSGLVASELFTDVPTGSWPQTEIDFTDPNLPRMTLIASDVGLANLEKMSLPEAGAKFRDAIKALDAQGFDACLIDTAPSLGVGMAAALLAADYVLSPIELEAYSIQGIKQMVTTIAHLRKVNPKLKFLGMVPSKVDARNPRHARHLEELERAYPQLMIPTGVGLRSSIADALASRVPVWKIKKTAARKATQEIRALAAHVFEKMEMTQ